MFRRKRRLDERPATDLVEEAFHLVRRAPGSALVAYALGTLPFLLGLLYFWSDMARSAFAEQRLLTGSLGVTALFFWMKTWHAVYAQTLLTHLCGEAPPRWQPRWLLRTALYQAIVQPAGIVLLPIALPLIIPFGWAYSFFNSATVFAGGAIADVKTLVQRSWRQAFLWPVQAQYAIFMFKFLAFFVVLNLFIALFFIPMLGKSLLGIESVVTRSPWTVLNTTTLAGVFALAWLCLDPFIKAVFVLRCFHGESLQTGQDLRAELKSFSNDARLAPAMVIVLLLAVALPVGAAEEKSSPLVTSKELDRSIDQVIQKREFTWRLPREVPPKKEEAAGKEKRENWIEKFFKSIESGMKSLFRAIGDFIEWMTKKSPKPKTPGLGGLNIAAAIKTLLIVLIVLLVGVIVWLLIRLWQRRGPREEVVAETVAPMPDVADENVGADQLPEDGWMRLARDLLARGDMRLALRAFYLASLAYLAERNFITLAKYKSNRDYERELTRRAHALVEVPRVFAENVSIFERVWYGLHDVTPDMLDEFSRRVERIKTGA